MSKVGLFSVGLDTYWGQFDSLLNNLKGVSPGNQKGDRKTGRGSGRCGNGRQQG